MKDNIKKLLFLNGLIPDGKNRVILQSLVLSQYHRDVTDGRTDRQPRRLAKSRYSIGECDNKPK